MRPRFELASRGTLSTCLLILLLVGCRDDAPAADDSEAPPPAQPLPAHTAPPKEAATSHDTEPGLLVLSRLVPVIGHMQVSTYLSVTDLEMTITDGERTRTGPIEERVERIEHLEVLALDPQGHPSKVKLRYEVHTRSGAIMGEDKQDISPTQGKSYLLQRTDNGLVVTYEDGSSVPRKEERTVLEHRETLLARPPFIDALPEHIELGNSVVLGASYLVDLLNVLPEAVEDAKMTLTLDVLDTEFATFSLVMNQQGTDENDLALTLAFEGTLTLDRATSWPLSISLTGTLETQGIVASREGDIAMQGAGTSTMSTSTTYATHE